MSLLQEYPLRGTRLVGARLGLPRAPFGHARLLFSKSHDGKGANGPENLPHDACPVQCRVPSYHKPCSEMINFRNGGKFKLPGRRRPWPAPRCAACSPTPPRQRTSSPEPFSPVCRKVNIRLPRKGNSNSHGARPVQQNRLDD